MLKEHDDSIVEGILICSNHQCMHEYPVIDGIPILIADLRNYITNHNLSILQRQDITTTMESLIGDCCGQGSEIDVQRRQLSTYGVSHYGDLEPAKSVDIKTAPGGISELLNKGLSIGDIDATGPIIDIGCSVGRTSFELAESFDSIVLGIDMNFSMLRTAMSIVDKGYVKYPRRRVGIVFDTVQLPVSFRNTKRVDFWACDATNLPFKDSGFAAGISLNTIDCVSSPYNHLKELARVLKPESKAVVSSPFDWNCHATPTESWIGGHSQRSDSAGSSEMLLRSLFRGGNHPNAIDELEILSENEDAQWKLYLYDRSLMQYSVHLLVIQKKQI